MDEGLFARDPPLVGRRSELARLLALLDPARGPGVLLLNGGGGVGKSRLARAVAEEAGSRGWSVARGRAYPVEKGIAYALFSDAFVPILRDLDEAVSTLSRGGRAELGRLFPALQSGERDAGLSWTDPAEFKTRLYWAFTEFLRGFAGRAPLLVVLDDLQWASDSSLELLHFTARHLPEDRVRFVCIYNDELAGENSRLHEVEGSMLAQGLADRLTLEPLGVDDTRTLVRELFRVDDVVSRELSGRLYEWTQGNLLFLLETLKELVETGRLHQRDGVWLGWEAEALRLPGSIREGILVRMRRRSEDARMVASGACAFGGPVSHALLSRVSHLPEDRLLRAVEELVRVGIFTEEADGGAIVYDFTHPMLRDGLYAELGLARTQKLHALAVEAIEDVAGPDAAAQSAELAYHLVRAGSGALARKSVRYLVGAGRDALLRHADAEAAQYLRTALDLLTDVGEGEPRVAENPPIDGTELRQVMGLLAQARARRGGFEEAVELWRRVLALTEAEGETAAEAHRRMGLACYWGGHHDAALAHFNAGLDALGEGAHQKAAALHLARGVCFHAIGRSDAALRDTHAALSMAEALDDVPTLARAHRVLTLLHAWTGPPDTARAHARKAVELALECGDLNVAFWGHWALAALEGLTGNTDLMEEEIGEAEAVADRLHSPVLRNWTAELFLERAYATGEWETGVAFGERAIAVARSLNQRILLPRLLVWTALIYLGKGELERGKAMVDEAWAVAGLPGAESGPDIHTAVPAYIGRAAYHQALGEWSETLRWGEAGLALADRSGYVIWSIHHLLPLVAEALIQTRDLEGAEKVGRRLRTDSERMGHSLGLAWAEACEALVVWLRGDLAGGVARLREAARALERIPMIPDAARIRRQLAGRLADLGEREAALSELRAVHDTLARLGNRRELEKARKLFQKLDSRPPPLTPMEGAGVLTGREVQVARMVAEGASNKSIARALGISPRTVTTHVANAFKKLGVSSRHELGELVRTGRFREG
jgi:DNA-binding CsgD family transcriptional regulator